MKDKIRYYDFIVGGLLLSLLYAQFKTKSHIYIIEQATSELIDNDKSQVELDKVISDKICELYHADSVLKDSIITDLFIKYHKNRK